MGQLLRAIPPDKTAKPSANLDEKLVATTAEIFKLEELGDLQQELLLSPASRGGWGSAPQTTLRILPTLRALRGSIYSATATMYIGQHLQRQ